MNYGLARKLDIYSVEEQKGETIITSAGDWSRADRWCREHIEEDGTRAGLLQTYCWAWFALLRKKKLAEYGISSELTMETLEEMFDIVTVYIDEIEADSLPLKGGRV